VRHLEGRTYTLLPPERHSPKSLSVTLRGPQARSAGIGPSRCKTPPQGATIRHLGHRMGRDVNHDRAGYRDHANRLMTNLLPTRSLSRSRLCSSRQFHPLRSKISASCMSDETSAPMRYPMASLRKIILSVGQDHTPGGCGFGSGMRRFSRSSRNPSRRESTSKKKSMLSAPKLIGGSRLPRIRNARAQPPAAKRVSIDGSLA
jgi:hypothetical protein